MANQRGEGRRRARKGGGGAVVVMGYLAIVCAGVGFGAVKEVAASQNASGNGAGMVPWIALLGPMLFEFVAGFAVGRIAGERGLARVLVFALLELSLSLALSIFAWGDVPVWFHLFALLAILPAVLAGGIFARSPLGARFVSRRVTIRR